MRILLTLSIILMVSIEAFAQKDKEVELSWKIQPEEKITYQTIMNDIDTSAFSFNFGNLFQAFLDTTESETHKTLNLFKQLNESFQSIDMLTELSNNGDGTVDIIMRNMPKVVESNNTDSTDMKMAEMRKMMQAMNQGVVLRGSVYETGGIHSFWVKSNQKNLIALFFELPTKPVKMGDSWELDINFISNDQNFQCDSAYKANKVTLINIKQSGDENIAVLKYEIEEFVDGTFLAPAIFGRGGPTPTMMKFTHQAIAEFSIDKGRWVSYEGIMTVIASGIMTANTKKKFSLIETK